MKLRLDLLDQLTDEDIMEEVLANQHRYKAEPTFSKTGVGYLKPATESDKSAELKRSEKLTQKLLERAAKAAAIPTPVSQDSKKSK